MSNVGTYIFKKKINKRQTLIRILINGEKRKQRIKEKRIAYMGQGRPKLSVQKYVKNVVRALVYVQSVRRMYI